MIPLVQHDRRVAVLLPYRKSGDARYEFFLQKRDEGAPTDAGVFSMFGGGIEGEESPSEALARELKEELEYEMKSPQYFAQYMRAGTSIHAFIEEVPPGFENTVVVHEGEYGKFLPTSDIINSPNVSLIAQMIVSQVVEYLKRV